MVTFKLLDPSEFKVLSVYMFTNPFTQKTAYVGYARPRTQNYDKTVKDDFDQLFEDWLKSLHLDNVHLAAKQDICFEGQLKHYARIYNGNRLKSELLITAHGDYSMDELMAKGQIEVIDWCCLSTGIHQ